MVIRSTLQTINRLSQPPQKWRVSNYLAERVAGKGKSRETAS
jgi:hypothetical protein